MPGPFDPFSHTGAAGLLMSQVASSTWPKGAVKEPNSVYEIYSRRFTGSTVMKSLSSTLQKKSHSLLLAAIMAGSQLRFPLPETVQTFKAILLVRSEKDMGR